MPPLRELEAYIFDQIFHHLWHTVLMEGATSDVLAGASHKLRIHRSSADILDSIQMLVLMHTGGMGHFTFIEY